MAGITDQVKSVLPTFNLQTIGSFAFIAIIAILIVIIIAGIVGLWAWWYINKKRFNKKIIIWGKVDGRPKIIARDVAMEKKIGKGGDTIFYMKRRKQIVPRPTIQTGDNTYWFTERQDGELINVGMEDFDLLFMEAKINYTDKESRYARASLQKLNDKRFEGEPTFWQKYGRDIMTVIFIIIITIMLLLILSKMVTLMGGVQAGITSSGEVMDKAAKILGKLDSVCGNSGVTAVPAT